jgi:hypothetical protein
MVHLPEASSSSLAVDFWRWGGSCSASLWKPVAMMEAFLEPPLKTPLWGWRLRPNLGEEMTSRRRAAGERELTCCNGSALGLAGRLLIYLGAAGEAGS